MLVEVMVLLVAVVAEFQLMFLVGMMTPKFLSMVRVLHCFLLWTRSFCLDILC